ncbi:MAG: M23 family metallopeptidase [Anaerolineae bacterium]|nr:M23 family metallopeptidase [Anaerolineae bacterium]
MRTLVKHFSSLRPARLALAAAVLVLALGLGVISPALSQPSIVVSMEFEYLRQGTAGVLKVSGPDLAGGVINVLDRSFPVFPVTDGFAAMIAVPIDQRIRKDYPMVLTLYRSDGSAVSYESTLRVESGEFIRESDFTLPSDRVYLLAPDIQANEDARLKAVYSVVTPNRFWEGQFKLPSNGALTSPFGSVRTYNDGSTRRHTGYDFQMTAGVPILSAASGRVVFARGMDIHGNIVIVDHGWGVFSSYSHMREMYVVPGQQVLQGEVLGESGNTGRSTGPHLHWEVAVNGIWVNPITFTGLRLPG